LFAVLLLRSEKAAKRVRRIAYPANVNERFWADERFFSIPFVPFS